MALARLISRLSHAAVAGLIGLAKVATGAALVVAVLPLAFILSAQVYRWANLGDWRPVPLHEFLEMLAIAPPAVTVGGAQTTIDMLVDLPATLVLFLLAAVLVCLKGLLNRLAAWQRRARSRARAEDALRTIERAFAGKPR